MPTSHLFGAPQEKLDEYIFSQCPNNGSSLFFPTPFLFGIRKVHSHHVTYRVCIFPFSNLSFSFYSSSSSSFPHSVLYVSLLRPIVFSTVVNSSRFSPQPCLRGGGRGGHNETKTKQKYTITVLHDSSGWLFFAIYSHGKTKTKTKTEDWECKGGAAMLPHMSISGTHAHTHTPEVTA